MCGIVGALSFNLSKFAPTAEYIQPMRDVMWHRGPDGGDTWVASENNVAFGHRRLSIIDLSTSATQPMVADDESVALTFNGEIYNHAEIRAELVSLGVDGWKTDHSDTEVILKSYQQWGIECLHKFRGMFAFAIYDKAKQELFLVRDRMGIKPLYYSVRDDRLVFASEIKALLKDPEQPRAVNEEALFHYLTFITTPAPMTLFAGINKLKPGTYLKVSASGEVHEVEWWSMLNANRHVEDLSDSALSKTILSELTEAVNYRKVADVDVGVFLSGGVDSSTNAALFSERGKLPVKTFSIGYDVDYGSAPNEFKYAAQVAEMFNTQHFEKRLNIDEMLDFLPKMVWLQDEPIADPVCVPVYFVSKLAKDNGVTVAQVGEGADELFCGYKSWGAKWLLLKANRLPVPRCFKRLGATALLKAGKGNSWTYEYLRRAGEGLPPFMGSIEAFSEKQKRELLSPALREKFANTTSWDVVKPYYDKFQNSKLEHSDLNWMTYIDLYMRVAELLLMRLDKMNMGVSLEGRVPFLDHNFVELVLSLPERVKMRGKVLKRVLKNAVRGLIPDNIIDRRKQGFSVPVHDWYFDKLGDKTREVLEDFCDNSGLMDKQTVMNLFKTGSGEQLWFVLNLALWWQHYIKPEENVEIVDFTPKNIL